MIKPAAMPLADAEDVRLRGDLARAEADLSRAQLTKARAEAVLAAARERVNPPDRWRKALAVAVPIALWAGAGAWFAKVWL